MKQYLIICDDNEPFFTDWYTHENNFNDELNMKVFDLFRGRYTDDGETWKPIIFDHL